MTTDIEGTVVAIQGNAVEPGTLGSPEDGYVLTWANSNSQWEAKPSTGLQSQAFNTSGTWMCPDSVNFVILYGFGGGGGGAPGVGSIGGGAGGGSLATTYIHPVVPGTSYTVTIGAGGTSGNSGAHSSFGDVAGFGGVVWSAAGGATTQLGAASVVSAEDSSVKFPSYGGSGGPLYNNGKTGAYSTFSINDNYGPGIGGVSNSSSGGGGGGGGLGPGPGSGGNGGDGSDNGVADDGENALANSGSGGGGGGGTVSGTVGSGGNGGSGQIIVSWIK